MCIHACTDSVQSIYVSKSSFIHLTNAYITSSSSLPSISRCAATSSAAASVAYIMIVLSTLSTASIDLPTPFEPPLMFLMLCGGARFLRSYLLGPRVRFFAAVNTATDIGRVMFVAETTVSLEIIVKEGIRSLYLLPYMSSNSTLDIILIYYYFSWVFLFSKLSPPTIIFIVTGSEWAPRHAQIIHPNENNASGDWHRQG